MTPAAIVDAFESNVERRGYDTTTNVPTAIRCTPTGHKRGTLPTPE
jgi:hypothetical protein